jgi:predicted nucleotide-binding protein
VLNETAAAPQNISPATIVVPQKVHEVLILHGQEDQRMTIAAFIQVLGLTPVRIDNHSEIELGLDLLDRFSKDADLAILLWTNDPEAEKPELKNIVYELGYFRGKLGRKHVCVLYMDNFRNEVEALSAFTGVVFIPFDTAGAWMTQLSKTIQNVLRPSA